MLHRVTARAEAGLINTFSFKGVRSRRVSSLVCCMLAVAWLHNGHLQLLHVACRYQCTANGGYQCTPIRGARIRTEYSRVRQAHRGAPCHKCVGTAFPARRPTCLTNRTPTRIACSQIRRVEQEVRRGRNLADRARLQARRCGGADRDAGPIPAALSRSLRVLHGGITASCHLVRRCNSSA
jgi:hypothetical protein